MNSIYCFEKIIALLFFTNLLIAQKYDANWIIGYGGNFTGVEASDGLMQVNFVDNLKIFYPLKDNPTCVDVGFTPAAISDYFGNLLFYTDAFHIYNRNHDILKNGEHINPGGYWDGFQGGNYPMQNGTLFLPDPGDSNKFYLFHKRTEVFYNPIKEGCDNFYYSLVDANGDIGNGEAIQKNVILKKDDFDMANLAACRHANGRDWWIIQKRSGESKYFIFLLDPSGVVLHHEQNIGLAGSKYSSNGNSLFTRDGSKYIQSNHQHHLLIMDFDRCKGEFSNQVHIVNKSIKDSFCVYTACSANSRYLYFCDRTRIWQYDLHSSDISKSELLVETYDGFLYLGWAKANFFTMQLTPDDKIYISCFAGNSGYVHEINYPDKKGVACDVEQRAVKLPAEMGGALPLSAYYKLGPVVGSDCDSLYNVSSNLKFAIYPNPFEDELSLEFSQEYKFNLYAQINIWNTDGKLVFAEKFTNDLNKHKFKFGKWPAGLYYYKLELSGIKSEQGKLIKL